MQTIKKISFFLLAIIIVLFIIVMIIFCVKGYNNLENKIDEIISIKFKQEKIINKRTLFDSVNSKKKNIMKNNKNVGMKKNKKNYLSAPIKKYKNNIINTKNAKNSFIKKIINPNNKKSLTINLTDNKKMIDNFLRTTNDYELNNLPYELALKYDKREFCDYYFSLIRTKQLIFFSFCDFNDYNSGIIKKFIFFLSFALHYTINALFFTDKLMHQIYKDGGKYNIIFQFPYITYSAIISTVILRIILSTLVLTEKSILEVKNQKTRLEAINKKKKVLKYVIIKFSIFFILNLILLILFWYYLTCFNALYANTQVDLIINTIISFALSLVYPFVISLLPTFFRMDTLGQKEPKGKKGKKKKFENQKTKQKKKNKALNKESEYVYKVSKWLQLL